MNMSTGEFGFRLFMLFSSTLLRKFIYHETQPITNLPFYVILRACVFEYIYIYIYILRFCIKLV